MGSIEERIKYPAGITKHFLEDVLKRPVESFSVKTGSSPGDNFLSVLYSIDVNLKESQDPMHLLMKAYPDHPTRQKFLDDINCFHKELLVYKDYVSELTAFPKKIGVVTLDEKTLRLAFPPLIHGEAIDYTKELELESECENGGDTPIKNYLLMVDIRKTWGFQMADKFKGLDYRHVKLVVKELAKLHALGWAYKEKNGLAKLVDKFPFLVETLFCNKQREVLNPMICSNVKLLTSILEKGLGHDSPVFKSFSKFANHCTDYMIKFVDNDGLQERDMENLLRIVDEECENSGELDIESWTVGGHGDCWVNNMLFRYDEKTQEPVETMLVDLQLSRESCPTIDLSYFLYTSTEADFRRKHLDEMLSIYHSSFLYFCKLLKTRALPGFTLQNLRRRFHRRKLFGFASAVLVLPLVLQTPGKHDMDKCDLGAGTDGSISDLFADLQRDEDEMDVISKRFLSLTQELYEQGVI